jgi:phytoene synthase
MKSYFDDISFATSRLVTHKYSTSFGSAVKLLAPSIRQDIYNIYGFVRLADEIVDSFQSYKQEDLFLKFREDLKSSLSDQISTNPVLNSFQHTVNKYAISHLLINAFMDSMQRDLTQKQYRTMEDYKQYIYGSADVVGLMCLRVFVKGNDQKFEYLQGNAMRLGSAFQKINFLRDIKEDFEVLNRSYFPTLDLAKLDEMEKREIIMEIEEDLRLGYLGILELPIEAKLGVYVAYRYYKKLLSKLKSVPSEKILLTRVRVPNYQKFGLFARCYFDFKLRLI